MYLNSLNTRILIIPNFVEIGMGVLKDSCIFFTVLNYLPLEQVMFIVPNFRQIYKNMGAQKSSLKLR